MVALHAHAVYACVLFVGKHSYTSHRLSGVLSLRGARRLVSRELADPSF